MSASARSLFALCTLIAVAGFAGTAWAAPVGEVGAQGASTLPPPVIRPVPRGSEFIRTVVKPVTAPLPAPVEPAAEPVPPAWSTPAPVARPPMPPSTMPPSTMPPSTMAPSTMAPSTMAPTTSPVMRTVPMATAPMTAAPVAVSERCWSGCGLLCESGISRWHARLVGGWPFYVGTDTPDPCSYWGVDLGRTHCGCWGYDIYYRMHGCKYDRTGYPDGITEDGGIYHHVGAKLTWERSFGGSRFYGWVGAGGGYWWTQDFEESDNGWEVFGEAGVGYMISQTFRVRLGLNAHGLDTSVGRATPASAGESRWLWVLAPVLELEIDF